MTCPINDIYISKGIASNASAYENMIDLGTNNYKLYYSRKKKSLPIVEFRITVKNNIFL